MAYIDEREFLKAAKQLISEGKRDFIKRTYHNHPSGTPKRWIEAMLEIGLTQTEQIWQEVLSLNAARDFIEGPVIDIDRPRDGKVLWIFKKEINGKVAYIKLKIDIRGCVCLSFHEDW